MYTIKDIIEQKAGIRVVSSAYVKGVQEFHSNCPFCGGVDRFVTRPDTGEYSCAIRSSGCGRHGDIIDFLQEYCHMEMQESIVYAGLQGSKFAESFAVPTHRAQSGPTRQWKEAARTILDIAERRLWHEEVGKNAREYLHSRGFTDETMKAFRLGYMPLTGEGRWAVFDFDFMGVDPSTLTEKQRQAGGVRVPDGILIPWLVGEQIWKLTVKRPGQIPGYGQIIGSVECLFNDNSLTDDRPAMMVESELCAISVQQEAGDLVSCVATSGDKKCRENSRARAALCIPDYILQSFDNDESGEAASTFWTDTDVLPHCMRWSPWLAKDPNDILRDQGPLALRQWVEAGIISLQGAYPLQGQDEAPAPIQTNQILPFSDGSGVFFSFSQIQTTASPDIETTPAIEEKYSPLADLYARVQANKLQSTSLVVDPSESAVYDPKMTKHVKKVEKELPDWSVTVERRTSLAGHMRKQQSLAFRGDKRDTQKYSPESWFTLSKGPIWERLCEEGFHQEEETRTPEDFWQAMNEKMEANGFYEQMRKSDADILARVGTYRSPIHA